MNEVESRERDLVAQRAMDSMREHFDTVLLLATYHYNGRTYCKKCNSGDFYCQVGMAREFLIEEDQRTRAMINKQSPPSGDDGPESWQFL